MDKWDPNIIADIDLPDARGFLDPAIILVVADGERRERLHTEIARVALGSAVYVLKGAPATELLLAIDAVLKGRRHLEYEVADHLVEGLAGVDAARALDSLSVRERQIVELVVRGKSSTEIAALLHLSPKTIDSYRSRLMAKLGATNVPALVRFAIRAGLISADEP